MLVIVIHYTAACGWSTLLLFFSRDNISQKGIVDDIRFYFNEPQ